MPGGDRTGPNGAGPMTGRRMGACGSGSGSGGGGGFGSFGRRRGGGRGNQSRMAARPDWERMGGGGAMGPVPQANADEMTALRAEADELAVRLQQIQSRIDQLENAGQ